MNLESFRAHLLEQGLATGTVDVYVRDIATALRGKGGLLARLRDDEIAPKTKRHILAAGRHWAEHTADEGLTKALKRLKLPPARRKAARIPMERVQLLTLVDGLKQVDLEVPVRAVIGLMLTRGLRVGDVLRLTRDRVVRAVQDGVLSFVGKGRRILEFKVLRAFKPYLVQLAQLEGWGSVDELVSPGAGAGGRRAAAAKAIERGLAHLGVQVGVYGLYPHRLRRTYAVEYLRQLQGDPEALMKLTQHMQWASMATAMEYVDHARGAELDAAADAIFDRKR